MGRVHFRSTYESGHRSALLGWSEGPGRTSAAQQDRLFDHLGGAFLTNAIPHVVAGMMGEPFQSPFAKPRGEGLSTSTVNILWGFFNLLVGYLLVCRVGDFGLRSTSDVASLGLGGLLIGLFLARHFGRFHGGNEPS